MATPAVTQSRNFSGQPQDFGAMLEKQGTTLGSFAQMILENLIITHDDSSLIEVCHQNGADLTGYD